jgi:hypothetical protein
MTSQLWLWLGFNAFVLFMLALDLGVFLRKAHVVSFREAIGWTITWITLAMRFNLGIWHYAESQKALEFTTGYLIKVGLGVVLTFGGVKMLLAHTAWKIDTLVSLGVIVLSLATSVVLSLVWPKKVVIPAALPKPTEG